MYRSDDQGKTWKRMTEYKLATPAAPTVPQADEPELDAAAQARESETAEALEALGVPQAAQAAGRQAGRRQRRSPPRPRGRRRPGAPHRRPRARAARRQPQAGSAQVNQTEGGYYGRIIVDPNDDKVALLRRHEHDGVEGLGQDVRRGAAGIAATARPTSTTAWSGSIRSTPSTS